MANVSGTFEATGTSASFTTTSKAFALSLSGFGSGTVQLQRYVNGGWRVVDTFIADTEVDVSGDGHPAGVDYRVACTAYTSGTIAYFLGAP